MRTEDIALLCCPVCRGGFSRVASPEGLRCAACKHTYPVVDGIPRLLPLSLQKEYNAVWDYKWSVLDAGKGYNFRMLNRRDPAYKAHNVIRFFEEEGSAFADAPAKLAVDVGCGTGHYSVELLERGYARKVIAIDLTRGVDIGKAYIAKRYPHLLDRIVFVQGDARALPVKSAVTDFSMALASIHHSGNIEQCLSELKRVTKPGKRFAVWVYCTMTVPFGDKYRSALGWLRLCAHLAYLAQLELVYNILRRLPNGLLVPILRVMASDTVYWLRHVPVLGALFRFLFPAVCEHPDKGYRLINLYDGYSPGFSDHFDEFDVAAWSKRLGFTVVTYVPHRLGFIAARPQ